MVFSLRHPPPPHPISGWQVHSRCSCPAKAQTHTTPIIYMSPDPRSAHVVKPDYTVRVTANKPARGHLHTIGGHWDRLFSPSLSNKYFKCFAGHDQGQRIQGRLGISIGSEHVCHACHWLILTSRGYILIYMVDRTTS